MIPTVFTEQLFRVFFRKNDPKLLEKAKRLVLRVFIVIDCL